MNPHDKKVFYDLLNGLREDNLTPEQFEQLDRLLQDNETARIQYVHWMHLCLDLKDFEEAGILAAVPTEASFEAADSSSFSSLADSQLWEALSQDERTSPGIELPDEKPKPELIRKVVYPPRQSRKISKFAVFALANAAAMLLFFLSLQMLPPKGDVTVATLTDSLHAKWADRDGQMASGTTISGGDESLLLREGYAEMLFANQTKVTIQGPAEFQIPAEDRIKLVYGRLYVRVPREAIGFTVKTPTSQIVDLGTEFGVDCDFRSNTSLHVIKGKTVLIAGDKSNKVSLEVAEGAARKVSSESHTISDISCNDQLFVREIDSADNFVWRGETQISLADIISGGTGFEEVRPLVGLDPVTGLYTSEINRRARASENTYSLVSDSPLIDGVFVPNRGPDGRMTITSTGTSFECPETKGLVTHEITVYTGDITKHQESIPPAIFGGQTYDQKPVVMIHSNAGITFDLQAIRQTLPGLKVTNFKTFGGVSEALKTVQTQLPDVDFSVLVDGQVRYEKKAVRLEDNEIALNIALGPQDRFLTLIVTDGYHPTETSRGYAAWNNDFFYLIDPTLEVAETVK